MPPNRETRTNITPHPLKQYTPRLNATGCTSMKLTPGHKLGPNTRRWTPEELVECERAAGIELPPPQGMLNVRQVAQRYGVSVPTIWRWISESRTEAA